MPEHGHEVCPHCEHTLTGSEATCPSCSGPLFGIAPKAPQSTDTDTVTIDNVAVPTYTPTSTENVSAEVNDSTSHSKEPSPELSADELIQQGEVLSIEGQHAEALRYFNQAIAIDPSKHMAWFNRGVVSEATGDVQDAVQAFKLALQNSPGHGAASANLAVLLQRMGHASDAVEHAQNGLIAFPGHPALLDILSGVGSSPPVVALQPEPVVETPSVTEIGEPTIDAPISEPEVETVPEPEVEPVPEPETEWVQPEGNIKSLGAAPNPTIEEPVEAPPVQTLDLDQLAESATMMIREGNPAGALESLRAHLPEAAAEHAGCWRVAAGAMARLDLIDAAINAFEYATDLDANDASAWFNQGALKKKTQDLNGALDCFQKALGIDSQYAKAANGLALVAVDLGKADVAIDAFRSLLLIEPTHASALIFAELLIDLAEGEGRAIEFDMNLPTTLPAGPEMASEALQYLTEGASALRARAFSLAGEHAESVTIWKQLVEQDKSDPSLWLGLARSLSAAGSEEKAAACRQKARDLGVEVSEPEIVENLVEDAIEPSVEVAPPVESNSVPALVDADDPWGEESTTVESVEHVESEPEPQYEEPSQITTEEIILHEAALDTVEAPEPVSMEPRPEVDLAAAALEAQSQSMVEHAVLPDSSSVANQDIEWYNKGNELLNKDRYSEALSCFDRALPSFKDDKAMAIKILNGRGNCFYYLNQYKDAIENYYKAFGIDKSLTTGKALYNMGTAYAELESYDNAIHCFNQSIGKDVGEPLDGQNKKRAKEQIRLCKKLLKEQKRNS